jgi:hypothetical protein
MSVVRMIRGVVPHMRARRQYRHITALSAVQPLRFGLSATWAM